MDDEISQQVKSLWWEDKFFANEEGASPARVVGLQASPSSSSSSGFVVASRIDFAALAPDSNAPFTVVGQSMEQCSPAQ
jgi:hypothetical protein